MKTFDPKNANLTEIVKDNTARFVHAIAGVLYYQIDLKDDLHLQFPVDMNDRGDIGTATFEATHKAITLMRYIRKAITNDELVHFWM